MWYRSTKHSQYCLPRSELKETWSVVVELLRGHGYFGFISVTDLGGNIEIFVL